MQKENNILIGVTGTIGTLTIPSYIHAIRKEFKNIKMIMTEAAENFIPKQSLSYVIEDIQSTIFHSPKNEMTHVELAKWADIFIVLPASAHTIAQVANGFAGSLLVLTVLAHQNPVLFFPNMNIFMWNKASVQRNLNQIREDGHQLVFPVERISYEHAKGDRNTGKHLPPPDEVVTLLVKEVESREKCSKKLLSNSLVEV